MRFWRVQRGPYATYFIPTINCVSLTNELLEKTDIGRTVMLGLKTPGAYLDLLEREYLAGNPAVTARRFMTKFNWPTAITKLDACSGTLVPA